MTLSIVSKSTDPADFVMYFPNRGFTIIVIIIIIISGESHVNTFLQEHKGAGIQHIALYTPTITATVKYMSDNGVTFRKPPPVYYEEGIKLEEIEEAGYGKEINDFKALGILLDTEADESNDFGNTETREKKR
nr:4-hydroxyphenylpyruvate dioxygenase-like [Cherax quadricarinatus]